MHVRGHTVIQYGVSGAAIALLVGHLVFPDKKIDAVTLGFLVVALIPWLGSVFKSLELPGGFKIEYAKLEEASVALATEQRQRQQAEVAVPAATAPAHPASPTRSAAVQTAPPAAPSYSLSAVTDSRLRLFALRAEIEKRLRELAWERNVGQPGQRAHLGPAALLQALADARALTSALYNSLQLVIQAGDKALEGAEVSKPVGEWAAESGPVLLRYLEELMLLKYAHVRVIPTPVFINEAGARRPVAPDGVEGVCFVKPFNPNAPNVVTLEVPLNGSYTIDIPRNRIQVEELDETTKGYRLRAEFRLDGLRIVIDPHRTQPQRGTMIWTEPA